MAPWSTEMFEQVETGTKYAALNEEQLERLADLYHKHGMYQKASEALEILLSKRRSGEFKPIGNRGH